MSKVRTFCEAPAQRLAEGPLSRFDPITIISIITTILPLLFGLCKKPTPEEQQKQAKREYRPRRNPPYTKQAMRMTAKRARHAARELNRPITEEEADEVAVETLDSLRKADKETFAAVWNEVNTSEDTPKALALYVKVNDDDDV